MVIKMSLNDRPSEYLLQTSNLKTKFQCSDVFKEAQENNVCTSNLCQQLRLATNKVDKC